MIENCTQCWLTIATSLPGVNEHSLNHDMFWTALTLKNQRKYNGLKWCTF